MTNGMGKTTDKVTVGNYMKLADAAESNEERDNYVRLAVETAKEDEAARIAKIAKSRAE